ncbi:MAG: 16S rRNA (cytidine(1402)-2'-O)-methyltransferase [Candidatus Zixiibacteriota bacterium]
MNKKGILYIIGTPIGNLDDISQRAILALQKVDIIACEDTRKSKVLLERYNITGKLIAHHAHNEKNSTEGIIKLLEKGKTVALVSDSGMPVVSDPGGYLIRRIRDRGYNIDIIPGPTALTTALSFAGISAPYLFLGFAPATPKKIRRILRKYKGLECPAVFYVAPHKLKKLIKEVQKICGNREIIIAKELTKIYQEILEFSVDEFLDKDPNLKGELVLIIDPEEKKPEPKNKIADNRELPFI